MNEKRHRAIIINDWWAGILGTLLASCIIGGVGFAWSANGQQAVTQSKVEAIEQAKLPERMARIEETVKSTDKSVDDIKDMQREMGRKVDVLLQNQLSDRKPK